MDKWDLLWSADHATPSDVSGKLKPGQIISIVPGLRFITGRNHLPRSLVFAYGVESAFRLMPRTFALPEEQTEWEAWLQEHPEQVRV
jgi:hypothetical protein